MICIQEEVCRHTLMARTILFHRRQEIQQRHIRILGKSLQDLLGSGGPRLPGKLERVWKHNQYHGKVLFPAVVCQACLLYTSDAADQ